jgi:hypothetical protein
VATNKSKPKLLNISQIPKIHVSHPEIGKAIQSVVDYVNKSIVPVQGNRIAKRVPRKSQI